MVQGTFSATLSVSKLYELSLLIIEHISEMPTNISINLHLRPCSIALYEKFYLYCLNCINLVYKLCITFWKCQECIGVYLVLT